VSRIVTAILVALLVFTSVALYPTTLPGDEVAQIPKEEQIPADIADKNVPPSIAVLPFENMNPSKENVYFAAGVHEDILSSLSKISELKGKSRTSVTDKEIRYAIIAVSKRTYSGDCPCEYNVPPGVSTPDDCAKRDFGNDRPFCWASDVSAQMVREFRRKRCSKQPDLTGCLPNARTTYTWKEIYDQFLEVTSPTYNLDLFCVSLDDQSLNASFFGGPGCCTSTKFLRNLVSIKCFNMPIQRSPRLR
jgi:hypothetical protein